MFYKIHWDLRLLYKKVVQMVRSYGSSDTRFQNNNKIFDEYSDSVMIGKKFILRSLVRRRETADKSELTTDWALQ